MKKVIINKNDAGQRIDKFLFKYIRGIPASLIYRYIRTKRVKVNNKRVQIDYKLLEGDQVELYINDELLEKEKKTPNLEDTSFDLDIIYEDENIILVNKKSGIIVHESNADDQETLIAQITAYLWRKGDYNPDLENSFAPALCNRIDRNTSGIVICAKNAQSLRIMNERLKHMQIEKYYLCIAVGRFLRKKDTLHGYLLKDSGLNKVKIYSSPTKGARNAITKYRVLKERDNLSLVEVQLITGRTHQIRAHLASIGHPILGDGKYGINAINKAYGAKSQFLCSYKLIFRFEGEATSLEYLNNKEFIVPHIDFVDWFEKVDV